MIWIWILCALSISCLVCRKRGIQWIHYIWFLLPIENYGIAIAGATVKPYMIFGIIIVAVLWLQKSEFTVDSKLFVLCMLILLTDILNGFSTESIMQHILFVICIFIFYAYCEYIDWSSDTWHQIEEVCIAMLIGYGSVFIIASFFMDVDGVSTIDRYSSGMYLGFSQYGGGYAYRLRGFTIDPNTSITALLPGFCCALSKFGKSSFAVNIRNLMAVIIFIVVSILTNSRMTQLSAMICLIVVLLIMFIKSMNKMRWIFVLTGGALVIIFVDLVYDYNIFDSIYTIVMSSYSQRAALTDETGRFAIWSENIKTLFENNKWIFGVGANQIRQYTELGKPCHNTYLEWICATGVFVGITAITYVVSALGRAINLIRLKIIKSENLVPFIIAYGGICLCLLSVDHIANPSLLILLCLFHHIADSNGRNIEIKDKHIGGQYG